MKYFQRALNNSQSFCQCEKQEATYYQNEAGLMKPVGELLKTNVNNIVSNVPKKPSHEPLGTPSMDNLILQSHGEEIPIPITKNNEKGLPLPSLTELILSEAKKRNKFNSQNVKPTRNPNYDKSGLPSMDYLIKNKS